MFYISDLHVQAMKILNENCMQMHSLIFLCFLFTFTATAATDDPNHISINCGGAAPAAALSGRQWLRDTAPKGSSTTATVKGDLIRAVDPVPYYTARISRSQFSYSFHVTPGQKIIRLHFNPVSYHGFQSFSDFFTVEAGPFTLLANFSASITARALAVNTFIKEFCVILQENQPLDMVFSAETSFHSKYNYAFINGIEIISVPSTISYCHGGDNGVRVLGKNYMIHVENTTALEMIHRQDIKWGSLSSNNDRDGMFGMWANQAYNRSWAVSVDVGFRYLVRLHLCDQGLKMGFMLLINNMTALTTTDMLKQRRYQASLWYKNYMVMMEGHKREGKRMISICVQSPQGFLDRHGPLEGFEVFKLSNHDLSLASPNPIPPREDSPSQTIHSLLSCLGRRNTIAAVVFAVVCMVNIIVHYLLKMVEADSTEEEEEDKPCDRVKQQCRCFSLAELQSATQNFHDGLAIGRGGFGKVYRGFIDNGREIVAIKRSKPNSSQGEHQFWAEVETLTKLRHVNIVCLIGYCIEQREMMLVYEYMVYGTLADHLYKLSRKSNNFYHLSWKQRLKICIGAGRALDYLHTGHGIIHRDVKSSNILLDEKFVAKVSDFGLAKTGSGSKSESQDATKFKGTFGYIDPNYFKTHKLTKKSDTYAFGVVLLEVLCGRPAVEASNEDDKRSLAIWAVDKISKGQVDQIVTPSLRGDISPDSLKTFVKVAEKCLHNEPKKRPAMAHVVIKLELALQQQDKMESLALNGTASGEDDISCTDISQKEIVNDLPSNDRAISLASLNVQTNASPPREQFVSTMINSGRKDGIKSMMLKISRRLWPRDAFWKTRKPSNKTEYLGNSASALCGRPAVEPWNEEDKCSLPMWALHNISKGQVDQIVVTPDHRGDTSPNSLNTLVKVVEKCLHNEPKKRTAMARVVINLELSLQQQDKIDSLALNETAGGEDVISCTDISQKENVNLLVTNEIANDLPCNDRDISLASLNVQTNTSPPRKQFVSTMIDSGRKDGIISMMLRISRRLLPRDAFWKTRKPSNKTEFLGNSASAPTALRTSNITSQGNTITSKGAGGMILTNTTIITSSSSVTERTDYGLFSPAGQMLPQPNVRIFTLPELRSATKYFRSDSVLGEGGFGKVYKGWLGEKASGKTEILIPIAVKRLNQESMQGFQEWQSEVNFLGRLSHPNLVRLLGYCREEKELLLVYEYMPKGSLENHLFGRTVSVRPLPWDIRLKILIGAAHGLAFLHASDTKVIFRDFKPSNILLDESYHPKLTDFGLAKMGPADDETHVSTQVMGTYGYAAPEYVATGHLYVKSDVYGFGMVMVEMLTGLRAFDTNRPSGQHNLSYWINPLLSDRRKLKHIIDTRLERRYPSKSAFQIAQLALTCLVPEPKNRPSMQEVVETLEKVVSAEKRGPQVVNPSPQQEATQSHSLTPTT